MGNTFLRDFFCFLYVIDITSSVHNIIKTTLYAYTRQKLFHGTLQEFWLGFVTNLAVGSTTKHLPEQAPTMQNCTKAKWVAMPLENNMELTDGGSIISS